MLKISTKIKVKYSIYGILLLAVAILCCVRWRVWFGNIPEQPYQPLKNPHNIVLTYGATSADRTITWRADTVLQKSQLILQDSKGAARTFLPTDTLVYSRAGKAVYYRVDLTNLKADTYKYQIQTEDSQTEWYNLKVNESQKTQIILFGDIQDEADGPSGQIFSTVNQLYPKADCWAFVGDIIERPIDHYWQVWFNSMNDVQTSRPIIAATGNHEHLKGVFKQLDSRWTHVFGNPLNGPLRALGKTYYIDFPYTRFIVIDTDGLNRFTDYTITSAWLKRVASESSDKWNILMMHHPIHSASMKRENVFLYLMLHNSLADIDLVLQGHDHTYARRLTQKRNRTTAFVETTTANKYYLPKVNPKDDRILSAHPVFNVIDINKTTLDFRTFMTEDLTLYDRFTLTQHNDSVVATDLAPQTPEIIDLPARYEGKSNVYIRRFNNRRSIRMSEWEKQHLSTEK